MRARLDEVQRDLDLARDSADRSAQIRLYQKHVPYLIHILRSQLEPEVEEVEEEESEVVSEPEPSGDDLVRSRLRQQGSLIDDPEKEIEFTTVEAGEGPKAEIGADQDDSIGEDSVAAPGSPTALAVEAQIAEAAEGDPLEELLVDGGEGVDATDNVNVVNATEDDNVNVADEAEDLRTPSDDPAENSTEEVEG